MTSELVAASGAYRAAVANVSATQEAVAAARDQVPVARIRLAEAIADAYRAGVRVSDIASISGYGREQVRRILRTAGIPAPARDE